MKGKQTSLLPGNEDRVGYWLTPPDLMKQLQNEFGFDFDACPYPRPAGFDGLKESWGKRTYVNPPFTQYAAWAKKAIAENQEGKLVVLIMPVYRYIGRLVSAGAEMRNIGSVRWIHPNGNSRVVSFPHILFILRPNEERRCPTCGAPPSGGKVSDSG